MLIPTFARVGVLYFCCFHGLPMVRKWQWVKNSLRCTGSMRMTSRWCLKGFLHPAWSIEHILKLPSIYSPQLYVTNPYNATTPRDPAISIRPQIASFSTNNSGKPKRHHRTNVPFSSLRRFSFLLRPLFSFAWAPLGFSHLTQPIAIEGLRQGIRQLGHLCLTLGLQRAARIGQVSAHRPKK